jgi:hypothetical protein
MNHDETTMIPTVPEIDLVPEIELVPEIRALNGAAGTPVVLADGREWLLADGGLGNALDEVRDRIDDAARLTGEVDMGDVREAAFSLLLDNYELTGPEAAGLILGADGQKLTDAVGAALFGATGRRTYTLWAASALLANGLDPATIPGPMRWHVLDHLVATRRAIPATDFIDSAVAAPRLAALRARAARPAPVPALTADAEAP